LLSLLLLSLKLGLLTLDFELLLEGILARVNLYESYSLLLGLPLLSCLLTLLGRGKPLE
jgi:hypothetical protein